ncbi:MAG: hypothetical protein ACREVN_10480 [Gammaproteobacteria bacterium]
MTSSQISAATAAIQENRCSVSSAPLPAASSADCGPPHPVSAMARRMNAERRLTTMPREQGIGDWRAAIRWRLLMPRSLGSRCSCRGRNSRPWRSKLKVSLSNGAIGGNTACQQAVLQLLLEPDPLFRII